MWQVTYITYANLGWGDDEIVALCALFTTFRVEHLKTLLLHGNPISAHGREALAAALTNGALPALKCVTISGDKGEALQAACDARGVELP